MTDRDVRREVADEIASVLETKADECAALGKGLSGGALMAIQAPRRWIQAGRRDRHQDRTKGILMGCDIHLFVEKRVGGVWVDITEKEDDPGRSYLLFACLAGVRNSHDVTPVAEPRGIPSDASPAVHEHVAAWGDDLHSKSWLTLAELLTYDWPDSADWQWSNPGSWWKAQRLDRWHQVVVEDSRLTLDDLRIVFAFDN